MTGPRWVSLLPSWLIWETPNALPPSPRSAMSSVDNRQFATDVVRRLRAAGHVSYWAGGCVRDLVRGVAPQDYDVATDARPDAVRDLFGRKRTLAVGEAFGVVIVLPPEGVAPVEVATFRSEGPYRDGRRPDSIEFCSPEADALRRDFTINGMFYDPLTEEIHDYVGGRDDIHRKIVRAIGDPAARMTEDKLRLLRAVRFAASLGFELDERTARAVVAMAPEIGVVSVERIAQELRKMLVNVNRQRAMALCRELGLLSVFLPEAVTFDPDPDDTLAILDHLSEPSFALALAALLRQVPNPVETRRQPVPEQGTVRAVCRRLKLSNQDADDCVWLHSHSLDLLSAQEMTKAQLKRLLAHPLIESLVSLTAANVETLGLDRSGLDLAASQRRRWTTDEIDPPPLINGNDAIAAGASAGPRLKELLNLVREAQLNEQIATRDEAIALLRQQLRT